MKYIIFMLTLLLSGLLQAGQDGGGGNAVVCRDSAGQITSAELFDLYEGRVLYNLVPSLSDDDGRPALYKYPQAQAAISNIQEGGAAGDLSYQLDQMIETMQMIPGKSRISPINDANYVAVPRSCAIEQAARFVDNTERLYVDEDIWSHFDKQNKSALLVHESVYAALRSGNKEKTSDHTRLIVASAFAKKEFVRLDRGIPSGIGDEKLEVCATPKGQNNPPTVFYTYPIRLESGEERVVLQFLGLNGQVMASKSVAIIYSSETQWPFSKAKKQDSYNAILESNVEVKKTLLIALLPSKKNKSIYIRIGNESEFQKVTCSTDSNELSKYLY